MPLYSRDPRHHIHIPLPLNLGQSFYENTENLVNSSTVEAKIHLFIQKYFPKNVFIFES
jgi:hypothetical protein